MTSNHQLPMKHWQLMLECRLNDWMLRHLWYVKQNMQHWARALVTEPSQGSTLLQHKSRSSPADLGDPVSASGFANIAQNCARGRADLAGRGLDETGRKMLRPFSTWEITRYLIPVAQGHFRRVLKQNPHLPQGASETAGGGQMVLIRGRPVATGTFCATGIKVKGIPP